MKVKMILKNISTEFYILRKMKEPPRESHNQIIVNYFENTSDFIFLFGQMTDSMKHKNFANHQMIMNKK